MKSRTGRQTGRTALFVPIAMPRGTAIAIDRMVAVSTIAKVVIEASHKPWLPNRAKATAMATAKRRLTLVHATTARIAMAKSDGGASKAYLMAPLIATVTSAK